MGPTTMRGAPNTATTVRFSEGEPIVTDGPFAETKEAIGGYAIVDVASVAEALEMAKSWPGRGLVEVRPVLELR
ncbi:MAG: YciI family protein [Chloroflexota bacterium]